MFFLYRKRNSELKTLFQSTLTMAHLMAVPKIHKRYHIPNLDKNLRNVKFNKLLQFLKKSGYKQ